MTPSVNLHHSASSQSPPVTPPYRPIRPPLTPRNDNIRRHRIPSRDTTTAGIPSLAHANAQLLHERLQQNHNRLQVQLHARQPPTSVSGPVKAFLDTTLRAYASRIQSEFANLRSACAKAVQREQQQVAQMRNTCAQLTRERDAAEEKLHVLLDQRATSRKRQREEVEKEDFEVAEATELLYPLSPISPLQLPTLSPPPRLRSPFVLAIRRSPSLSPDSHDRTEFDLTVAADSLPRPSKKRRMTSSPECTFVSPCCDASVSMTKQRETCPPASSGECDMDLESDSECDSGNASSSSSSLHPSRAPSCSPPLEFASRTSTEKAPAPTRARSLPLEYVDIMYLPTNGKLVCRVCLLAAGNVSARNSLPIKAFLPGASWDMLRTHSEESHPEACQDVVGLGPAGVQELRRRLGLGPRGSPS
ncbi:hypothetical protein R3P38DRAFT_3171086 [Favolaschia claudopus]|uniref:Uncharacterized protein n=1 Tax=Favolaschia claudopus TaxID=2862362 RepID=A0AAW0DQ02_9AGAR